MSSDVFDDLKANEKRKHDKVPFCPNPHPKVRRCAVCGEVLLFESVLIEDVCEICAQEILSDEGDDNNE